MSMFDDSSCAWLAFVGVRAAWTGCLNTHCCKPDFARMPAQEREAKRAKLKSENAHAYIQEDTSASNAGQAKHITAVSVLVVFMQQSMP